MTTVATRVRYLSDLEGFDIIVKNINNDVFDLRSNGALGAYPYEKKLKHSKTVSEWKAERFQSTYHGYTCDVLLGDGSVAAGQTLLRTVRESYEGD